MNYLVFPATVLPQALVVKISGRNAVKDPATCAYHEALWMAPCISPRAQIYVNVAQHFKLPDFPNFPP